jgi:hypothetical protein
VQILWNERSRPEQRTVAGSNWLDSTTFGLGVFNVRTPLRQFSVSADRVIALKTPRPNVGQSQFLFNFTYHIISNLPEDLSVRGADPQRIGVRISELGLRTDP